MAIEKATEELKNQNPSGLDRRLLLPSVEAKAAEAEQSEEVKGGGLFRSINQLTVSLENSNEIIIDQLVELNETMLRIEAKEPGAGGAENILQTVTRLPGRAVRKVGGAVSGIGRAILDYNPISLALGAGRSALRGVGRGLMAGPRAIGNLVGNMFQSKNQKALFDITQKNYDNTTAIRESNEDMLKEIRFISKALANEFKLRRSGRLDALEKSRDGKKRGVTAAAVTKDRISKDKLNRKPGKGGMPAPKPGGTWVGTLKDMLLGGLATTTVLGGAKSGAGAASAGGAMQSLKGTAKTLGTKAGGLGLALSGLFGFFDTEYKEAGINPVLRSGLGMVENVLSFLDFGANQTNKTINMINPLDNLEEMLFGTQYTRLGTNADSAGMFKRGAISAFKENQSRSKKSGKIYGREFRSESAAVAAAEKATLFNYKIEKKIVDNFLGLGQREVYKIVPAGDFDETPASMNRLNVSKMISINDPGNMFPEQGSLYKLKKNQNQPPVIELHITPNSHLDELFKNQLENNKMKDRSGTTPTLITPMSDNRNLSTTNNNQTVLSQIMGSTADQTNKVVPV